MRYLPLLVLTILLAAASGCQEPSAPGVGDVVKVTGTVRYETLEGGFWAVRGDDGTTYDPMNGLAAEFQKDGLRVWMEARLRPDRASAHMVGPIVDVIRMRALYGAGRGGSAAPRQRRRVRPPATSGSG